MDGSINISNYPSETTTKVEFSDNNHKTENDIELMKVETTNETNQLKTTIEKPTETYGDNFLDYLNKYPITKTTIESYLQSPETIENWSTKIENIWGEFSFSSLDPQLQEKIKKEPALLQNMKTGLSLYFTDWMNGLSKKELAEVANVGTGFNGLLSKASDLMGIFKNLTSFTQQMKAITTLTEGIDIYSNILATSEDKNISNLTAFQSPEGFVRLLKKHTKTLGTSQPTQDILSFEAYFDISGQPEISSSQIINGLASSYGDNAHKLMSQVLNLGPKVLKSRTKLKNTFGDLYDQISQIVDSFSIFTGGKSLNELIKGTPFEGPLNMVGIALGIGPISKYERKNKIKELTKKCPDYQKAGLLHALNYITSYDRNQPSQEFAKIFDQVAEEELAKKNITKEFITSQLPNENLLKKGILDSFKDKKNYFFIHPKHLQSAGINNIEQYYSKDKDGNLILNPSTLSEYKTLIENNIDKITQIAWLGNTGFFQTDIIISMVREGKNKSHISSYLLSGLTFPDYALDTAKNDFMKGSSLPVQKPAKENDKKQNITNGEILEIKKKGDLRYLAPQYPNQARAKNNNPAGITRNNGFENPVPGTTAYKLQEAGISFEKGTPRPSKEGGYYVVFKTIEDGLTAQKIIMKETYKNKTVNQMLNAWVGTAEGPSYAQTVAGNVNIDLSKKVSDLSQEELNNLQKSKIQKESPGLYKLLA